MEDEEEEPKAFHFTLHLDKPLPCLVEIAAWNPEKDLLAMVSTDHQLTVHRFNWQRLWAITPDKQVTSICWRPDGKALAAGLEDGEISLHDVENGDVMRKIETHKASIQCLYWVEEKKQGTQDSVLSHEDRTPRFFPPPPKAPAMPGTGSAFDMVGVLGSGDDQETTHQNAASKTLQQHLNILCSGDSDGIVCLNAFGVFPIGQLDLQNLPSGAVTGVSHQLQLSATKVTLSGDLCNMVLLCHERPSSFGKRVSESIGLVAISVDTNLLSKRHKEIRQVALQASSVEELLDVLQTTLTVMNKQWSDAVSVFTEKFTAFHTLLREHGSQSTPRDELLSLLACGSASASLHQFLAVTLGEGGLKRLAKNIDAAGRELHNLIAEHLQPAAEIIAFRIGELLALSHWRSHLQSIGLDESLVDCAMENAGMLLVQVERLLHVVSDTTGQFRLFFVWLTKSLRQLNGESVLLQAEQGSAINSAAIAAFLKSQFECDPIGPNLSSEGVKSEIGFEEDQTRAEKLLLLGGFKDTKFLQRTLFQQFDQLCVSCRAAFSMPVTIISPRLFSRSQLSLCQLSSSISASAPLSLTYYEVKKSNLSGEQVTGFVDCTCFQVCVEGSSYIGVIRQMVSHKNAAEVAALQLEGHLACVDLALYKEKQLVLLVTEAASHGGNNQAWIMVLQLEDLPFISLNGLPGGGNGLLRFCTSNEAVAVIGLKDVKARCIPQLDVIPPLAVSASRGLACVFAAQRRALLYDMEEDEEEKDNETT